jgi:diaminohydroxyphosphoribosylaminopyrimidine deaminase/5-amino-6-(5-phosphoribosylamino)uracil reductase
VNRDDARWLARAVRLGSLSLGMTWPNPGVGCILVRDGRIVGEGRHRRCGDLHAETAALADATGRGEDTAGAVAYVTLAPCTRQGRQPPCVDALARARVSRVVAGIADPHQDEAAPRLVAAGIDYEVADDHRCADLHGGFLTRIRLGRPRFTGKWAATLDGRIALSAGGPLAISDGPARELARRRRRAFDAILVGAGTLRADDPRLNTPRPRMHGRDPGPLRIVLAGRDPLPAEARAWAGPALVVHDRDPGPIPPTVQRLPVADVRDLPAVATALGGLGLNEVLVEGGAAIHGSFLAAGLYDRIETWTGPLTVGTGIPVSLAGPVLRRWRAECAPVLIQGVLFARWRSLPDPPAG